MAPPKELDLTRSLQALMGAVLRMIREGRGLSQDGLASLAHVSGGYIAAIERSEKWPSESVIKAIDEALQANGTLTALRKFVYESERLPVTLDKTGRPVIGPEMDLNRRKLLQSAGAETACLLAAGVATQNFGQTLRELLTGAERSGKSITDWEDVAWDYSLALCGQGSPPVQVIPTLLGDLSVLQQDLAGASGGTLRDLQSIAARMSMVLADAYGLTGKSSDSHDWWGTSQALAEACGDSVTMCTAYAMQAKQGAMERRPLGFILRRYDAAMRAAGTRVLPGVLRAKTTMAQYYAVRERKAEALVELRTVEDLAEQASDLPDRHVLAGGWSPALTHLNQSLVASHLGDIRSAETAWAAMEREPSYWSDARRVANGGLHRALCMVKEGDHKGGLQHAQTVVQAIPSGHLVAGNRRSAENVIEALPEGVERDAQEELRQLLRVV